MTLAISHKITELSYIFYEWISINHLNELNINNVTNLSYMFFSCSSLTSISEISEWKNNKVEDISIWNISKDNIVSFFIIILYQIIKKKY